MRLIDGDAYAAEMRERQENCRAWKDSLDEGTELYARAERSFVTFVEAALTLKSQPTIDAIPVEWLRSVHENWLLTPDEMEFRDWLIERWQKEQEAQDE
jgi:hypothetical protein